MDQADQGSEGQSGQSAPPQQESQGGQTVPQSQGRGQYQSSQQGGAGANRGPQGQRQGQQQQQSRPGSDNRGQHSQGRGQQQQQSRPPGPGRGQQQQPRQGYNNGGPQGQGRGQQQRPGDKQQQPRVYQKFVAAPPPQQSAWDGRKFIAAPPPQQSAWGEAKSQSASPPQQQQAQGGQQPQAASPPQQSAWDGRKFIAAPPPQQSAWGGQKSEAKSQSASPPQQQEAQGGQQPQAASPPRQSAWDGRKFIAAPPPQQSAWGGQKSEAKPQTASPLQQQAHKQQDGQKSQGVKTGGGGQKPADSPKSPAPSVPSLTEEFSEGCYSHKGPIKSIVAETLIKQIPVRQDLTRAKARGQPIDVFVNMLAFEFSKNCVDTVIHYDVDIDEKVPKNAYRLVMEKFCAEQFPGTHPAFDGRKNLFAARNLFNEHELKIDVEFKNMEERDRVANVKIKKVSVIDISWIRRIRPGFWRNDLSYMTSIQAIDVILKAAALGNGVVPVGRSIFPKYQPNKVPIGEGSELWIGTFTSAIMGWKPYLNVDVAHTAFPAAQNVADYIGMMYNEKCNSRSYNIKNMDFEEYNKILIRFLRGLRVRYEIPGKVDSRRVFTLEGLGREPSKHIFMLEADGGEKETTVEAYYAMKSYKIRYGNIPVVQVRPAQKNIFVPPELCFIEPGQSKEFRLSDNQTREIVRFGATSTDIRKKKIYDGVKAINYNADPTLREFGIRVGTEFEQVKARVLDAPSLQYNNNQSVTVSRGVWNGAKFLQPGSVPDYKWTLISIDKMVNDQDLKNLQERLSFGGRKVGLSFGKALTPFRTLQPRSTERDLENCFADLKKAGVKLTIVVISEQASCYEKVKQMSELRVGMLTQCVKANTVKKKLNHSTVDNIVLKINAKMNGTSHSLLQKTKPKCLKPLTMIIGADVTHPDPGIKDNKPSIAAVAANHDQDYFKYNITIRLQPCRTEIIVDLENIVRNEIKTYKEKTGSYPELIIFFRDGVSEGQFPQVIKHEIEAVKEACKRVKQGYNPPLTFMVVQKRHHTRFFPKNPNSEDRKNNNVSAGTIVDTTITHPTHIDFYLVSHASIQGTARPTKYRCLCNEANISEDDIEELTYHLCHLFSRCNRSVSYPAPTYYAHLGAFRARAWTHNKNIDMTKLPLAQKEFVTERVSGENPMFFV